MEVTDEWLIAPLCQVNQILKVPIQGLFKRDEQMKEVERFEIEGSDIEDFTVLQGNECCFWSTTHDKWFLLDGETKHYEELDIENIKETT